MAGDTIDQTPSSRPPLLYRCDVEGVNGARGSSLDRVRACFLRHMNAA